MNKFPAISAQLLLASLGVHAVAAKFLGFSLSTPAKACGIRGDATVTVSNYVRYTKEGDGNDTATLRIVRWKANPEPLPCSE